MTSYSNGEKLLRSLSAPAYSIATTSRLVGITRWSIVRYLRGYEYKHFIDEEEFPVHQPPVINQSLEDSTYASFLDLVDLLVVKEFLDRGFTLQRLRPAFDEVRNRLGTHHFATSKFYTHGDQITLELPSDGTMIALLTGGQIAMGEITRKLSVKLDFEDVTEHGFARRFYPQGKAGAVVIDPEISFGRPVLIGYGVATSNIYDLYLGEDRQAEPVSSWFNIPVPQIETAVQFEHSLWV